MVRVIDDHDYYPWNNIWLSQEERKNKQKEYEEEHMKRSKLNEERIRVDFTAIENDDGRIRYIVPKKSEADNTEISDVETSKHKNVEKIFDSGSSEEKKVDPNIKINKRSNAESARIINRVQYGTYFEPDYGYCICTHQPFASLLISGVKKHEGRTWYTTHRGKLWIASSSKKVLAKDISYNCAFYRRYLGDNTVIPTHFSTGVILGSADLVDCLSQDEYREKYPNGEIEDAYVFIFENPVILKVEIPIKAKSFIFPLDEQIIQTIKLIMGQNGS